MMIGWGGKNSRCGAVRSGVTPGATKSGVIPPPKITPMHAPGFKK